MTFSPNELPHDIEKLPCVAANAGGDDRFAGGHNVRCSHDHLAGATIASQAGKLEELTTEMEKMRKLLSHLVNGHRSEKRILPAENQAILPFENSEEFLAARAEAEAEAATIVQTYTVTRTVTKKKRDESLPAGLPRIEKIIEADETLRNCATHGERKVIGYDKTETLIYEPPKLYVLVKLYPKFACEGHPDCGVASPPRPTSLVEGDRYDTSVGGGGGRCQVVPAPADLPAPGHLRQQRLDAQPLDAAEPGGPGRFRDHAAGGVHDPPGAAGPGRRPRRHQVAACSCRGIRRWSFPAMRRACVWRRRSPRRGPRATRVCWRRCGPTWGSTRRRTTSSTSACRGTGTGRTTSSGTAAALCKEIASRAT